jgi:serine/threonine protein kinase
MKYIHQRYSNLRCLKKNKYAAIYQAIDRALNQEVILKIWAVNSSLRLKCELYEILKNNPHPNVIKIIDYFIHDQKYLVVVSEKIEANTLSEILYKRTAHTPLDIDTIFHQVSEGLLHLHSLGILHNDFKPGNIFTLEKPDNLMNFKLFDFSVSSLMEKPEQNISSKVLGTPEYMAPEAYKKIKTSSSDIWSLGVTFYEVITKKLPFGSRFFNVSIAEIKQNIFSIQPEMKDIPLKYLPLIKSCLEKNYSKRSAIEQIVKLTKAHLSQRSMQEN